MTNAGGVQLIQFAFGGSSHVDAAHFGYKHLTESSKARMEENPETLYLVTGGGGGGGGTL